MESDYVENWENNDFDDGMTKIENKPSSLFSLLVALLTFEAYSMFTLSNSIYIPASREGVKKLIEFFHSIFFSAFFEEEK